MTLPRTTLITGGTRGIGAACARWFARRGDHVVVSYRSRDDDARALVDSILADGGTIEALRFDVRDRDAVNESLEPVLSRGPIHVLVNNAGISSDAAFPALDESAWVDVTRTTLDGFFHVTQSVVMAMVRARYGRIINVASVSGVVGNRGQVNYSAAKAGLIGATRSLSLELAKRNITVNAVAPGLIDTEMLAGLPLEEATARIPMRRLGRSDEVAELIGFLAGDAAAYITGQVIGINGGLA